jgi:hypothetical protein
MQLTGAAKLDDITPYFLAPQPVAEFTLRPWLLSLDAP